jgi:hypothetical protein
MGKPIDQPGSLLHPLVLGEWAIRDIVTDVGLDVLNVTPLAGLRPADGA